MFNVRIQFEKKGGAAYISHLDLMKTLQRALLRAQLPVKYTEGFNPHIYLSILVPLSTGYQSEYDLCDFGLLLDSPLGSGDSRPVRAAGEDLEALQAGRPGSGAQRLCAHAGIPAGRGQLLLHMPAQGRRRPAEPQLHHRRPPVPQPGGPAGQAPLHPQEHLGQRGGGLLLAAQGPQKKTLASAG